MYENGSGTDKNLDEAIRWYRTAARQMYQRAIDALNRLGVDTPDNLVSLCSFHHALEPEKGHERIWGNIKTQFFTLVCAHERTNRTNLGTHHVQAHLRRLQLVTLDDLKQLTMTYGFCCPTCGETKIKFTLFADKNTITVKCPSCLNSTEGAQQLAEETGPRLAELLTVSRNKGRWKARWDMLSERTNATWGIWSSEAVAKKRKAHKAQVELKKSAPSCPKCGANMKLMRPRPADSWNAFWGCTQYSATGCKGSERYFETI